MWKLFILTFLCLFLKSSCDEDNSGDVKTTQVVAAAAATGSSSDGDSATLSSAAAVAKITSVKTEESSDPSSGSENNSNSGDGSYYEGYGSEEDDEDKECNEEERDDHYDCTSALHRVRLAIIKIAGILKNYFLENNYLDYQNYCDIKNTQGKEEHIDSPLSTFYTLAMTYLYTENVTKHEVADFLHLKNKDECRCVMKKLMYINKLIYKDLYIYGAEIIAPNEYPFDDIFKKDAKVYYGGKAQNLNFNNPLMCAKKVNKYVAGKTRNYIKDVVSKQEASKVFNADQITINVIGIFLKPILKMSLNTANKTIGIYYGLNEPTLAEYNIYQEVLYNSTKSRELDSWVIEIPLSTTNASVIIILPNTRCGLKPMIAKLASEPQILIDVLKRLTCRKINLTIPAYANLETVENTVKALQSTGKINRVFDEKKAEIIDSCGRLLNRSVTYIHQKVRAKLTFKGAEPYKTASEYDCSECGEPVNICINRPALYIYMSNGIILSSVIGKPKSVEPCTDQCFTTAL